MSDRIELRNLRFEATHGWHEHEQRIPQPFEVDVELGLDLAPAGATDDLARTVDYGRVAAVVRSVVQDRSFRLLETIAATVAREILAAFPPVDEVVVRIRKPAVDLGTPLDWAAVEIRRGRNGDAGREPPTA